MIMKRITDFVKKVPTPYYHKRVYYTDPHQQFGARKKKSIAWYFYILFMTFYCAGINVFFTKNLFFLSLLIKLFWVNILIIQLYTTTFSFAEGFIFFTICGMYFLHFFDIFLLFFFAIFIPNGHKLFNENI